MVLPHLVLAHLLADYVLQTNWIFNKKQRFIAGKPRSWDGMLAHVLVVWILSLIAVSRYASELWPFITLMTILHAMQDILKIRLSPPTQRWAFVPYAVDQTLHLVTILVFAVLTANLVIPPPSPTETRVVAFGACFVGLTRFYEVTLWANWPSMRPYMRHWRLWGYTERTIMFALSAAGVWWLAPLAALPRILAAQRSGFRIIGQSPYTLEVLLGTAFSVILGFVF